MLNGFGREIFIPIFQQLVRQTIESIDCAYIIVERKHLQSRKIVQTVYCGLRLRKRTDFPRVVCH